MSYRDFIENDLVLLLRPEVNKESLYLQSDTVPPSCSGKEMGAANAQDCPLVDRPAHKQKQFKTRDEDLILAHKKEVLVLKQKNYILQTKVGTHNCIPWRGDAYGFGISPPPQMVLTQKLFEESSSIFAEA